MRKVVAHVKCNTIQKQDNKEVNAVKPHQQRVCEANQDFCQANTHATGNSLPAMWAHRNGDWSCEEEKKSKNTTVQGEKGKLGYADQNSKLPHANRCRSTAWMTKQASCSEEENIYREIEKKSAHFAFVKRSRLWAGLCPFPNSYVEVLFKP